MPPIIQDMPWITDDVGEVIHLPNGRVLQCPITKQPLKIWHDQIMVWASLAPLSLLSPPPDFPVFPLLIDSGFNDSFLMQARQAWSWMTPTVCRQLPQNRHRLPVQNAYLPNRSAAVWIYPNQPGSRDPSTHVLPVRLELEFGVTLVPPGPYAREKPLLGVRAIRYNKLNIRINGQHQRVWIDIP